MIHFLPWGKGFCKMSFFVFVRKLTSDRKNRTARLTARFTRHLRVPFFIVVFDLLKLAMLLSLTMRTTDDRLVPSDFLIWRGERWLWGSPSCDMISSSTVPSFSSVRVGRGRPGPVFLSTDPVFSYLNQPLNTTILPLFLFLRPPYFIRIKTVFIHIILNIFSASVNCRMTSD